MRLYLAAALRFRGAADAVCALLIGVLVFAVPASTAADEITWGAYLVRAGGCVSCHTEGKGKGAHFAGGHALKTPFGTYYSPNITPDKETGIGGWTDQNFIDALHEGISPEGDHYFPVFPYTTYSKMSRDDALAIKAYLFSLKPVRQANKSHDVWPPFGWRWTMAIWKSLYFEPGRFRPDPSVSDTVNRGAYLVEALAHCGECHTPRDLAGALKHEMWMAGTTNGPNGELVPNITPDIETGIADWSEGDIVILLQEGTKPDFDDVQGTMAEAVTDGLSHLTEEDLKAIAVYLKAVPAIRNKIERKRD